MAFSIASIILWIFSLVGAVMLEAEDFQTNSQMIAFISLYIFIPIYGALGIRAKNKLALLISIAFFVSQSIRHVNLTSLFPHKAPISLSVPVGDFNLGNGYLVDLFAIFMAVFLVWLLKVLVSEKRET